LKLRGAGEVLYKNSAWVEKCDCFNPQREGRENRGSLYQMPPVLTKMEKKHGFVGREKKPTA